jgi:hypothetical protein
MDFSALLVEIADSTLYTLLSGMGAGAITFPADVGLDRLLFKAGASVLQVMLIDAAVTALFAASILVILFRWLRHSRITKREHVRRIYTASDRIRNELQTLVYAAALTGEGKETVKTMFKATEEIVKELEQLYPAPRNRNVTGIA